MKRRFGQKLKKIDCPHVESVILLNEKECDLLEISEDNEREDHLNHLKMVILKKEKSN